MMDLQIEGTMTDEMSAFEESVRWQSYFECCWTCARMLMMIMTQWESGCCYGNQSPVSTAVLAAGYSLAHSRQLTMHSYENASAFPREHEYLLEDLGEIVLWKG
jgi:hypothetical protein